MAFTVYNPKQARGNPIPSFHAGNRISDQVVLSGTDPLTVDTNKKGIFFLEQIIVSGSGTVTIANGFDETVLPAGTGSCQFEISPIRCDGGIKVTGTVIAVKGFWMWGVIA